MTERLLTFFQLCDSNFPIGGFSHSYGLETYIQEGVVSDKNSFQQWLFTYFTEQVKYNEGLAFKLVTEALELNDLEQVWYADRLLHAQNLPKETREGNMQMGDRMLKLARSLYDDQTLEIYQQRLREKTSFGHGAVVFAMIAHHFGARQQEGLAFYLYSLLSNLVQNAVRSIPLGQTAGQLIMHENREQLVELANEIGDLSMDEFGIVSPGLEISQMKHEHVKVRIFMS
ncbi:urease accessory protein UreF [Virgibacillus xinjiangensis]|uniref:Urease accessory protein UreF n=1 Tax=Virgibacillus xinjiangensis TaxID=393090 RepID=A0ABV7CTX1_9BACI